MNKAAQYRDAIQAIDAMLENEHFAISKMAGINSLLKQHFPAFYWVGFYLVHREALIVGPYIGTPGCIHISFNRGVCGKAARTRQTQIVADVHALEQGTEHIACDPATRSEIVVPVFNHQQQLIAVLDIDSTDFNSFDAEDAAHLEAMLKRHFTEDTLLETNWLFESVVRV